MDLKDTPIEIAIGPYEVYTDRLFGQKAAFESFVTLKDPEESAALAKYKAHPGKLSYGHATSSSQVPPAIIAVNAPIDVFGAAYKSLSQIIIDIAGGITDFA